MPISTFTHQGIRHSEITLYYYRKKKMGLNPETQGWFNISKKSRHVIYHMKINPENKHAISKDAKIGLNIIPHLFMEKIN